MTVIRKIDFVLNVFLLFIVCVMILGLGYDTYNSFINPEEYRHVQYSEDWKSEGFGSYILGNVLFILGAILIGLIGFMKIRNGGKYWIIAYYVSIVILTLIIIINSWV